MPIPSPSPTRTSTTTILSASRALLSLPPPPPPSPSLLSTTTTTQQCPPDEDPSLLSFLRRLPLPLPLPHDPTKALHLPLHRVPLKSLNSILHSLVKHDIDLARRFYREKMAPLGDHHTFAILMKGLCRTNRIAEAFKLLQLAKAAGLASNPVIHNTLIHALCRNGKVGRARSLLGGMESPSEVTFNIMIYAYCHQQDLVTALVMLEKCFGLGLLPSVIAITKIAELLCKKGRVLEATEVVRRAERRGVGVDAVCYNALVDGFCRIGKARLGRKVVEEMERKGGPVLPNVKTYNLLIRGYCANGEFGCADELFREMGEVGIDPNYETFNVVIGFLCSVARVAEALRYFCLWEEHEEFGRKCRIEPYNSVLYGLYKAKRLDEAYGFLGRMRFSFPRAVERTVRIVGLCERGRVFDARKVFDEMMTRALVPSVLVYAALVDGFCREGELGGAFEVVEGMVGRGVVPVGMICRGLVEGLCRGGEVGKACGLLGEMGRRGWGFDGESYGVVLEALCAVGEWERACRLVEEMVGKGFAPDGRVWDGLVEGVVKKVECVSFDMLVHSDQTRVLSKMYVARGLFRRF